ncbi:MAG: hypothetical protein RRC07_02095 [Anaerolineae bacterium]|nr:hypothetical protein [Anaerolineae bacterium]
MVERVDDEHNVIALPVVEGRLLQLVRMLKATGLAAMVVRVIKRESRLLRACTLFASVALAALIIPPAVVAARTPQAVDLIRFELHSVENGVEIEWETGTEQDVAYFRIKRGSSPAGPFTELTEIGLIAAEGSTFAGAVYAVVDETAGGASDYTYQLYEITLSNDEDLVAEASISLVPTPTPEIIGGGGGGGATSTPAPTSTRRGESTATPAGNGTPAGATATPIATGGTITATMNTTATATLAATTAGRVLGPTPTRFSFTPNAPVTNANPSGAGVAEAAGPTLLAQVTSEPYPEPGVTVAITPLTPGGLHAATQTPLTYPLPANQAGAGNPAALPDSAGRGEISSGGELAPDEGAAADTETSGTTRLLLWFGFLAALFIFIGGIAVSIILSTRRRYSDTL